MSLAGPVRLLLYLLSSRSFYGRNYKFTTLRRNVSSSRIQPTLQFFCCHLAVRPCVCVCRLQSGMPGYVERRLWVVHVRSADNDSSNHQRRTVPLLCQYFYRFSRLVCANISSICLWHACIVNKQHCIVAQCPMWSICLCGIRHGGRQMEEVVEKWQAVNTVCS